MKLPSCVLSVIVFFQLHAFADTKPSGAELIFPSAQATVSEMQSEVSREISKLKKSGDDESLKLAARIEEKLKAAKRVKNGVLPRSQELEIHAIGLYEGKASPEIDGRGARVRVTMKHAPLILCLTAYEPVTWMLEIEDGVDLRQVILGGNRGTATGLPDGTPIADYSRARETGKHISYAYKKVDEDEGSRAYDQLCDGLESITGLRPVTFDGDYNPRKTFVVGPESNVWGDQKAYELMREAWLLSTASKRNEIWDELLALRFSASHVEQSSTPGREPRGQNHYHGLHSVLGPIQGKQTEVGPPRQQAQRPQDLSLIHI